MKIRLSNLGARGGNMLVVAVISTALMALVLFSYLQMVGSDATLSARSQSWNSCIAVAEAGAEEAMAHLNRNGVFGSVAGLASQGWAKTNGNLRLRRTLGGAYYEVTISPGKAPEIISTGYVPASTAVDLARTPGVAPWDSEQRFLKRSIRVVARAVVRFPRALMGNTIDLNGEAIVVDSFDSYDPNASKPSTNAWGVYDPAKRKDNGDVVLTDELQDTLSILNAHVYGKVLTGPEGRLKEKVGVVVGSLAWHNAGNTGIQPGWSGNDANFDKPEVEVPFKAGLPPMGGVVGTNTYDYILPSGNYEMSKLTGKVLVTGQAKLLVTEEIAFNTVGTANDGIEFAPGAQLEIYMAGKFAQFIGKNNGAGFMRTFNPGGNATNFFFYGLEGNEHVDLEYIDEFVGMIYAPNAEIVLRTTPSSQEFPFHAAKAIMGRRVRLEKSLSFHYDENVRKLPPDHYVVGSWEEI